jgi:hypothetical protein
MMAIRKYILLLSCLLIVLGCEKEERPAYSNELGQFVRFFLQVEDDGKLINAGEVDLSLTVTDSFQQQTVQTLFIPVAITSEPLKENVEVYFSIDTLGTYTDFVITPEGILNFSGTDLIDTISLDYLSRWDASVENKITFTLDAVSDDSIHLGNLNSIEPNTTLTVNLEELYLRYNFPLTNAIEILGEIGETLLVKVEFPDGFFPSEIGDTELVIPDFSEFDYTLEQLPYTDDAKEIVYQFTLNEALDDDKTTYRAGFLLAELQDYHLAGYSSFSITKPENIQRDISLNPAGHFYNLGDAFYRTYGETWMDYNEDDTCAWTAFNQFTYPVVVSADHPNAIVADDMGTQDPNDDIYHHAFRVGFNSPNEGRTTNSFNLKRWFKNNYSDADESPGFNIPQALEFYPDNEGTSATGGVVKVIPQDLIISGKLGDGSLVTHTISIEGEGEYFEISDGIFEISLEFRATNMDIFGGTQTVKYRMYNTSTYDDPVDRMDDCFTPMDL